MSLPDIPDIVPMMDDLSISEVSRILLIAVALGECSLMNLIEVHKIAIEYILDESKKANIKLEKILEVNQCVNDTMHNMIILQILMQVRLDSVKTIVNQGLKCVNQPLTKDAQSSPIDKPHESIPYLSELEKKAPQTDIAPREEPQITLKCYKLIGKGIGEIQNPNDELYQKTAAISVFVDTSNEHTDRSIYYCVGRDINTLCMVATGGEINIKYPSSIKPPKAVITGKSNLIRKNFNQFQISEPVDFMIRVWDNSAGQSGFRMLITSRLEGKMIHDSGFISTGRPDSDLHIHC